jgi:imidazolonepropionase-like amidohydrolase
VPSALHLRGTVLPDGVMRDVFAVDGRITFTEQPDAVTVHDGGYLVPGLVDVHAHLSLNSPAGDDAPAAERAVASARAQLEAGVLAIREPGSPDPEAASGLGPRDGLPRIVTAGHLLCAPGRYFPGLGREVDSAELGEAAEAEARASAAWVKVIADFPGPGGRIEPSFTPAALVEAAARAHAAGARITAHATCPEAIDAVIEAGFDSIEHATQLRPDHLDEVARRGIALVPTLIIREGILAIFSGAGPDALAEITAVLDAQPGIVRSAAERGIAVLAGTDAGMVPHGMVATEVGLLLAAGLEPDTALAAASWQAREFLGLPGIAEGAPADLVSYDDDPRADVEVLRRPRLVVLDGRRVDRPGRGGPTA